jgi:hypothetical protein
MKPVLKLPPEVTEALLLNDVATLSRCRLLRGKVYGKHGKTVLHYAAKYSDDLAVLNHCIKTLRIKPDAQSKRGRFLPIHVACKHGRLDFVKALLVNYNVSLEVLDQDGQSPLSLAVKHNCTELSLFLLEKNANIHIRDRQHWTPLHWACKNGNFDLVNILLQAGGNPNLLTKNDENALHLSIESGCTYSVNLLLKYVFPMMVSKKGTIFHHCGNNTEMVDYLIQNTQWNAFPKLAVLLEIKASVHIIMKYCRNEFVNYAFAAVLQCDREDLLEELYFSRIISAGMLEGLAKIGTKERCRKTLNTLSRWQTVKKILFVYKYSSASTCKLRLPASLLRELISQL